LAGIWARALGVERVGINDSFLDLGGHSLLAIETVAEISALLGIDVLVSDLMATPTVAGMAEVIARTIADQADPQTIMRLADEDAVKERGKA
jgi:hypothetical protein